MHVEICDEDGGKATIPIGAVTEVHLTNSIGKHRLLVSNGDKTLLENQYENAEMAKQQYITVANAIRLLKSCKVKIENHGVIDLLDVTEITLASDEKAIYLGYNSPRFGQTERSMRQLTFEDKEQKQMIYGYLSALHLKLHGGRDVKFQNDKRLVETIIG